MTISLPAVKKAEIQRETTQLLRCPSIRTLAYLLGKLVATKPAVFIAPLHYCTLQSLKISALHAQQETVALSPVATDNLKWWSIQLHLRCSSPILKPEASMVITSDASLKGCGAACQERTAGGLWSTEEACFHINLLELKAPYLFALFCLISRALSKISREAEDSACLVAPAWLSQIWYPQLLAMLTGPPILLLMSPDHIPSSWKGACARPPGLYISGNISRCKGFLQELQSSSLNHGEATPMMPTAQPGASSFAGVLNRISIPFQCL